MSKLFYLFLFAVVAIVTGCRTHQPFRSFVPHGTLQGEQSYGDYVVRIYRNSESSFEILQKGFRVYGAHGHCFYFGSIDDNEKTSSLISIGSDITGDGEPNLVISEWTGGAHCCYLFHVFEIGKCFRYIQTIDAQDAEMADFVNRDDDPALEFILQDWSFAYWKTCFASSPAPRVILKYNGRNYSMACNLMRQKGPSAEKLRQIAEDIKSYPEWQKQEDPPPELWTVMLDLIYTGNMNQAWIFADLAWPANVKGKEQFLQEFRAKLAESPYWKDVKKLNKKHIRN